MGSNSSLARGNRGLRWKLTLSYTAVTVGALITVEIILLFAASVLVFVLVNSGTLPAQLVELASTGYTPILRVYLSQTPADVDGLAAALEQLGPSPFARGGFPLIGFLATTYDKVGRYALERR